MWRTLGNIAAFALLIFLAVLLQTAILPWIAFGGNVPDFFVILIVACSFLRGQKSGIFVGFFCGIIYDIFYADIVGFSAICYMLVGFLCGLLYEDFAKDDYVLPLLLILGSAFGFSFLDTLWSMALSGNGAFFYFLAHRILPTTIYTLVLGLVAYPPLKGLFKLLSPLALRKE